VFRGSRKRVSRIRWRGNSSPEFWVFMILLLVLLLSMPWLIEHNPHRHDHETSRQTTPP